MRKQKRLTAMFVGVLTLSQSAVMAVTYDQAVLDDNPRFYFRMDEATGTTAIDSAGGDQNGNYAQFSPPDGVATLGAEGIPGTDGKSICDALVRFGSQAEPPRARGGKCKLLQIYAPRPHKTRRLALHSALD